MTAHAVVTAGASVFGRGTYRGFAARVGEDEDAAFDRWVRGRTAEVGALGDELETLAALPRPERVTLVHGPDDALAARCVAELIEDHVCAPTRRVGVDEADPRRRLGAELRAVAAALRDGPPTDVVLVPAGGGAAALAAVVATLLNVPAAHRAPGAACAVVAPPVAWDLSGLPRAAPLARRAAHGAVPAGDPAVSAGFAAAPWLFDVDAAGAVHLGPLGWLLRDDPAGNGALGAEVLAPGDVGRALGQPELRSVIAAELRGLLRALERPAVDAARHEARFGTRGGDWHLFSGAAHRAGVFRAVYRWRPDLDELWLGRLWFDRDPYGRALHGLDLDGPPRDALEPLPRGWRSR